MYSAKYTHTAISAVQPSRQSSQQPSQACGHFSGRCLARLQSASGLCNPGWPSLCSVGRVPAVDLPESLYRRLEGEGCCNTKLPRALYLKGACVNSYRTSTRLVPAKGLGFFRCILKVSRQLLQPKTHLHVLTNEPI